MIWLNENILKISNQSPYIQIDNDGVVAMY